MERLFSECVIWSAGVDWLTMTFQPHEHPWFEKVETLCEMLAERKAADGHKAKAGKLRDYEGVRTEGLFWGVRPDGYIVESSSETADHLARLCIANGCEGKATRVDCQVTIQFSTDDETRATQIYDLIRTKKAANQWAAQIGLSLVETCGRGDSISIGSRTSNRYRRVYDKTREQACKIAPRLWRWEVEHKGDMAIQALAAIVQAQETCKISKAIVAAEFIRCGLPHDWMHHSAQQQLKATWTPTDNERRLNWLANQVKPAYQGLRQAGREEEALDALGFWTENICKDAHDLM